VARLERVHQQAVRDLDKINSDIQGLENDAQMQHHFSMPLYRTSMC